MNTKIVMSTVAALALAAGLILGMQNQETDGNQLQTRMKVATLIPHDLKTIPDVSFIDQNGNEFSKKDFSGNWQLLFFGYTHCPDVCPMTMSLTDKISEQVNSGVSDNKLQIVFISVDPERDTPEHLREYVTFFNPEFVGLSSSDSTLQELTRTLGVVYQRVENAESPKDYLIDHSANLMLVAPSGEVVALFTAPHESDLIATDIFLIRENYNAD